MLASLRTEFFKSIKDLDTEEKLDLYFYRPIGFLIAKISSFTPATPTALTIIGMLMGASSGFFFYQNHSTSHLVIASLLLVGGQIFDSADGQLARMVGRSSKFGLILDGICDNIVFGAAYISCAATVFPLWGWWIVPITLLAGICHSFQSAMLDFYNREYLAFGRGRVHDYWNPTLEEAKIALQSQSSSERRMANARYTWIWQQTKLSSRTSAERNYWKILAHGNPHAEKFQQQYRDHNRLMLRFWRIMGANFHTILILVAAFYGRFDYYLIFADIIGLTLVLLLLRLVQSKIDGNFRRSIAPLQRSH